MCIRYFIYNFVRLVVSLIVACLVTIEYAYCACDKEDWCKGVPPGQECACYEIGLKCLANNHETCVTTWKRIGIDSWRSWSGNPTRDAFPNYTISTQKLKKVLQEFNKELPDNYRKIISNTKEAKDLISEIDIGIKERKDSLEFLMKRAKDNKWLVTNYDAVNNDIRSDILLQAGRKQTYYASVLTTIKKISEQRAANKGQSSEQDNAKLDATINEFFTDTVKALVQDINDIEVINNKISSAYQSNKYDDIIEFSEDLKNKLDSVRKTQESLNDIYEESKSYLEKYGGNVDNIVQNTVLEVCKNTDTNSQCREIATKLLQDPHEYFTSLNQLYESTDRDIESVKDQKKLKSEQDKEALEQQKQKEQEEKKKQDNTKIKDLKGRIANNMGIIQKWERYITDDQVIKIINRGISSEQDRKLLQKIAANIKQYKDKVNEITKDISELQKLDSKFGEPVLNQRKMENFIANINKTLQSSTISSTGTSTTRDTNQDGDFEALQPVINTNCNFTAYNSIRPEVKDNTLISFIYDNINFGCSNTCSSPNKSFEICLKIKRPDHCGNCVKINIDDSEFRSIKELFGAKASDKNDVPVLVRENAVNTIQLKSMSDKGLLCLYARTAYGNMPLVCKNISSDMPQVANKTNSICNLQDHSKSRVPFNFSGRAMECIKSTLDGALYGTTKDGEQFALVLNSLASFQQSMKGVVSIGLILYITLFALKAMFIENFITREKLVTGILKIIIVAYLSVGLNPINKMGKVANGIQDYLLPLFSSITYDLSHLLLTAANTTQSNSTNSQSAPLCYFNPDKDYRDSVVGRNYALWDSIDCRLSYYLGYRLAYNYAATSTIPDKSNIIRTVGTSDNEVTQNMQKYLSNGLNKNSALDKDDTFLVLPVIWKMLLGGELIVSIVMITFCFVFVTLIWKLIGIFITNLVNLYVMFYLSPITVPMLLFEQTKSIFNRWLTMTFSFALQPGIAVSFIAVFMILMDSAVYKTCEFVRYDYQNSDKQIVSTFELKMPPVDTPNIDIYTNPSEVGENAKSICMKSPGYRLMEFYNGKNLYERSFLFFKSLAMNAEIEFLHSMVAILVFCIIFYYFFGQVDSFAAMLTNGVSKIELSVPSLPSIPGIGNRNNKQEAKDKYSSEGKKEAQDKFDKGKAEAKDQFGTARTGITSNPNDSATKDDTIHSSTSSRVNNTVKIKVGDKEIIYDPNSAQDAQIVEHNKDRSIGQPNNEVGTNITDMQETIGIKVGNKEFNFNVSEVTNNQDADKVVRLQIGEKQFTLSELMQNSIKENAATDQIDTQSKDNVAGTINVKIGNKEFNYDLNELIDNQVQIRDGVRDNYNKYTNSASTDGKNSISDTDTTSGSPSIGEKENNDNRNK